MADHLSGSMDGTTHPKSSVFRNFSHSEESFKMKKSKALYLLVVGVFMVCLMSGSVAMAQPAIVIDGGTIVCKEDTAAGTNGVIDIPTDSLIVTVKATLPNGVSGSYALCEEDSVEVGLWPIPGLGDFSPAVPQITYLCNPVELYRMSVQVTPTAGMEGGFVADSCLVTATLIFHPENLACSSGTIAQFSVTVKSADDCWPCRYCRSDPLYVEVPCSVNTVAGCGSVLWDEYDGFKDDNIIAIYDTVWWVFAGDTVDADTFYINFQCLTCDADQRDTMVFPGEKRRVNPCNLMENGETDTIWVRYAWWVPPDSFNGLGGTTQWKDTCYVLRRVDNTPPFLGYCCVDSCHIVNANWIPNDTTGWWPDLNSPWWPYLGIGDTLRIYWSFAIEDTCPAPGPYPPCAGDTVTLCNARQVVRNVDGSWVGVDFQGFVQSFGQWPWVWPYNSAPGGTSPYPGPGSRLIVPDSIWIGNEPWAKGLYVDIPIDTTNWSWIQACISWISSESQEILLYGLDDAGNRSGDQFYECDFCIDNICTPALSDIYADTVCRRFSPYDSTRWVWWNISPDSIRILLDDLDNASNTLDDSLDQLFLVGIDVRSEPDEIVGNIVAVLDYFNPLLNPIYIPVDRDTWLFPEGPFDRGSFIWYGKQGTDSLDDWLNLTGSCPLGFNVGFTLARFMDRAGNSCIRGWDNDSTTVLPEWTQRNRVHAVVDTCIPGVVSVGDTLVITNIALGSGPPVPPSGPEPGYSTYKWVIGDADPILRFRPERFYDQGDGLPASDSCLMEKLFYHVLCERVITYGVWPNPDDTVGFYSSGDATDGSASWIWEPIEFFANDVNGPIISFNWGHKFPGGGQVNDGLYRLELQILDDAGMIYYDPVYVWLNQFPPDIDTAYVTDPDTNCTLHFFVGDTLCVTVTTDTSAQWVEVDWTCIFGIDTSAAHIQNLSATRTVYGDLAEWLVCVKGVLTDYVDTLDATRNDYELDTLDNVDCQNSCNRYTIGIKAFDIDGLVSAYDQACGTGVCQEAILGLSPCPRIATNPQFFFYNPDSMAADSANNLGFPWGPMPQWNAFSPGNLDHAYSASLNWAQDNVQDTVFIRVLIDSMTINPLGGDTIELSIQSSDGARERIVRRPLFSVTPATDAAGDNTIYHGRLTNFWLDATTPSPYYQFIFMWNGTWFISGGMDSIELVDFDDQDTVLVSVAGLDSSGIDCDTVHAPLDVDNINPEFYDWTGIAPGTRDPNTGSTPSVLNLGVDNDCGFRFAEGDTFRLKVKLTEQVHFDSSAYPNKMGCHRSSPSGEWALSRNWQITLWDDAANDLLIIGDTVEVFLDWVEEQVINPDSVYYILTGHFESIPDNYCNTNCRFIIRSAWDQAGNPGRYNNPPFTDAYEEDSAEDTSFALAIVNIDPFIIGCPLVWNLTDSIPGWIAPEDLDVEVKASIIETREIWACDTTKVDSIQHIRGAFQMITGDPNPWVNSDSVGDWYLWANPDVCDSMLFWARDYYWWLRADSSNLATVHCDGDSLDFYIRFNTFAGYGDTAAFNCVQVDVNEPRWRSLLVDDPHGGWFMPQDTCINPRDTLLLVGLFTDDFIDTIPCPDGNGIGVVDTLIWADLSAITGNADDDSVRPDTVGHFFNLYYAAWRNVIPDSSWYCLDTAKAIWKAYALTDSIGHYDRELYRLDTICFTDDCLPPELDFAVADCHFPAAYPHLGYLSPGSQIWVVAKFSDPDADSSLGIDSVWCDAGELTGISGWAEPCWQGTCGPIPANCRVGEWG
jgi:hypothetical protein